MGPGAEIASLLESAISAEGDSVAVAYRDVLLTYRELDTRAARLAARLRLQPGQRVVVVAHNVPSLVTSLFAVWKRGGVAVPLSARLRSFELERVFASAQPTAAIAVAMGGFDIAGELRRLQVDTASLAQCLILDPLGEVLDNTRSPADPAEPLAESVAAILYTSGTTGEPKGVLVSHGQAQAQTENLAPLLGPWAAGPAALAAPATHSFGLGCLLCTLAARGTAVLADVSASVGPLVDALRTLKARVMHGSPALFARLLEVDVDLPLRRGFTGGSSCPPGVFERLDARGFRLLSLYGMSESGGVCCPRSDDPPDVRYHTAGRPLPGYEVRTAPREDAAAATSEIEVRSVHIWPGYLSRAWTTDETPGDGWLRTGDLGSIDAFGNLSVAGRAKEVIHVGGFNVFPAEVETFLLTHPGIAQAAVVGIPHAVMGEVPQAFVVLDREARLEPADVVRFARSGIAGYKVPYAVRILDGLPTLPSGKLDRRALARSPRPPEPVPQTR